MSGWSHALVGWLRDGVGRVGGWALSHVPAGLGRQIAAVVWVALLVYGSYRLLRVVLRWVFNLVTKAAHGGPTGVRATERFLMWVDYRVVIVFRTVGLSPLYWPSEAIEKVAAVSQRGVATAPAKLGRLGPHAGRIALIVALLGLVGWDFSVCSADAESGCVRPHAAWWGVTSDLAKPYLAPTPTPTPSPR